MHTAAVSDLLSRRENTDVLLVTFTNPENLPAYQQRYDLSLPVVVDADRSAYRAFGLGRGSVARIWGLRAAKRYIEIFRSHGFQNPGRVTDDTLQLGGDFIIDPDGTLIYGFWGDGPDDRPSAQELLDALPGSPDSLGS